MTTLCGGGTSGPQAGTTLAVDFTISAISVALAEYGASWAIKAIPFVTSLPSFVLSTFCSTDPPTIPTFTQAEADALLNLTFDGDFFSGLPKMVDLISHVMWYQVCTCTSGALTALPAAPAPPTGTAVPTNAPGSLNPACENVTSSSGNGPFIATSSTFHNGDSAQPLGQAGTLTDFPTSFRLVLSNTTLTGSGLTFNYHYIQATTFVGGGGPPGGATLVTVPAGTSQTIDVLATAGNHWMIVWLGPITTGTGTADPVGTSITPYCGGATPGGTQSACCPPDPSTQFTLEAILSMVTLLQRQLAPFSTIHGASHTGLSGSGSFAVQGLIGLSVDITTAPARLGTAAGDPVSLWDAGWVNLGTSDGFGPRQFIASDPFLIQPVPGNVTVVGYSIPADVTVAINEIVREP